MKQAKQLTEEQQQLVEANLRVAEVAASKASAGKVDLYEELLGVCQAVLVEAALQFDPEVSHNGLEGFAAYAGQRCKWQIAQWFREQTPPSVTSLDAPLRSGDCRRGDLLPDRRVLPPDAVVSQVEVAEAASVRPVRLAEVRQREVVPEAGQWAAKLRLACYNAVTEDDMTGVMAAVVKKAKKGDLAAAKLLLDYLAGGRHGGVQQTVIVQQRVAERGESE